MRSRPIVTAAVAVAGAIGLVYAIAAGGHTLFLAITAVLFAIAAVGLSQVVVSIGQVSLGHAAFFGLGAYTTGILTVDHGLPAMVGIAGGVLVALAYGAFVGPLSLRSRGIAFVMVTLAFGELVHAAANQLRDLTGGDDGLTGVDPAAWGRSTVAELAVVVAVLVVVILIGRWFWSTTMGRSVNAARQDEAKAIALGYPVRRARILVFIASAAVAGLAGALYAHHNGFVSPTLLSWLLSGELLVMVLVGGGRSMIGAAAGAVVLTFVEDIVSSRTERWELVLGAIFIGVVVLGIYSSVPRDRGVANRDDDDEPVLPDRGHDAELSPTPGREVTT